MNECVPGVYRLSSTPAGFEPANLGYSGEYDNHGTTGVDQKLVPRYGKVSIQEVNVLKIAQHLLYLFQ